jgi:hypothetical protein
MYREPILMKAILLLLMSALTCVGLNPITSATSSIVAVRGRSSIARGILCVLLATSWSSIVLCLGRFFLRIVAGSTALQLVCNHVVTMISVPDNSTWSTLSHLRVSLPAPAYLRSQLQSLCDGNCQIAQFDDNPDVVTNEVR